ncbi:hypothetical protein A1YO_04439 [Escherichia coli KTE136]|mgnify:CR=1 FL=1|jgi:hypothetical protein|nr:hypothetical protein A1YO_04439 [Escherichia coli KTE136]
MFLGLFVVFAGFLYLLESLGFLPGNVEWGVPLAMICFGLHLVYEAVRERVLKHDV